MLLTDDETTEFAVDDANRCVSCDAEIQPWRHRFCASCFSEPDTRILFAEGEPPAATDVCPYPPGSPQKVDWLAARYARREQIFCSQDATMASAAPGEVKPRRDEVTSRPELRVRGVEKDGCDSRGNDCFRARPMWNGRKQRLGSFATQTEANQVVEAFWRQKCGLFWQLGGSFSKDTGRRRRANKTTRVRCRRKQSSGEQPAVGGLFAD